ncbi:hypothetical protein NPIL_125581 [Nephila pilipes]|uniref:Uncharacterized protein n=1 Tax=Nephila pilipes TaxID=299642 RepID=A0A8X6MVK2_NEPPI|nr:hypothetical protein NPIL_125581 [Nephila pilipes]
MRICSVVSGKISDERRRPTYQMTSRVHQSRAERVSFTATMQDIRQLRIARMTHEPTNPYWRRVCCMLLTEIPEPMYGRLPLPPERLD